MDRSEVNYLVDALMGAAFLASAITGLALFLYMPSGVRQGGLQEFLGIAKRVWSDVHDWSGITLLILIAIHLVLHRSWIVSMTRALLTKKNDG